MVPVDVSEDSFTANITQLQNQVTTLQSEAREWQSAAEIESQKRTRLEVELVKAKAAFQALRNENVRLKEYYKKVRRQAS